MELNIPNILLILAAAQGLLLAVLIFQKHRAVFANRYLALLMLGYTGILIHLLLQDTGLYVAMPFLFLISGLPLAAMPLHYLYTKHLVARSQRFTLNELLHFLPFGIYECILIVVVSGSMMDFSNAGVVSAADTPPLLQFFNAAVIVLGLSYLALSLRLLNAYRKRVKDVVSSVETVQLTWLRNITLAGFAAVSVFLIEDLFLMQGINVSNFILSSLGFALYVYGIGYGGLLSSEIFANPAVEKAMHVVEEIGSIEEEREEIKYERSGLSGETAEQHLQSLLRLMEEKKLYRSSALTLTELSEALAVTPHNLSEVINTKLRKNFYDFVNGYRLEEVKKDLVDPSKQHLKILSIAFDAGFNSKATFNTLFKEQTGMTPSEFRNNAQR